MKRSNSTLILICLSLLCSNLLPAQNVDYPKFTVPVYRYATDQRYSDHKKIFYVTGIEDKLGESLFPLKSGKFQVDTFALYMAGEIANAGVDLRVTNPDLTVVINIESYNVTVTNSTTMMGTTTYNVDGKGKLFIMNEKNEPYEIKPISFSESMQLEMNDMVKNNYTKNLANQKAQINYSVLVKQVRSIAMHCEDSYINSFKKREIVLTNIARAQKKYPDLLFFDSLNTRLVNELNAKATTDYKQFITPYETEIMTFINKDFPKGYDVKNIKLAGYYTLAFLYYLAYDNVKLKQALDFLYENSNKFLGNRIQYSERKPLMTELEAYNNSINSPKITVNATSSK